MKPKVSVIVPIYNAEMTLEKCLDSIRKQSLEEIEIICVNDGSMDKTGEILQKYEKLDSRIKVITIQNSGGTFARKTGLQKAIGEYVGFVDADDWIEPCMYEALFKLASEYDVQLVSSGYILEGNYINLNFDGVEEGLYDENTMDKLLDKGIYNVEKKEVGIRGSLCCKLFDTKSLIEAMQSIPDTVTYSEDKMCVITFLLGCKRAYITHKAFYHYIIHDSSLVHKANLNYLSKVGEVYRYLTQLYAHPRFSKSLRLQSELYITELLYKGINSRLGFENKNMLWVDPFWMEKIPLGANIALYGIGELCDTYYRQAINNKKIHLSGCFYRDAMERKVGYSIQKVNDLIKKELQYDFVVITIKNKEKAMSEKQFLISLGVNEEKILWFDQQEIFWKFAKANGLLN